MIDEHPWGERPRVDVVGTADALAHLDALLARGTLRGRPVRYALDGDGTPLGREEVAAWLTGAEAEGLTLTRCTVDARGAGAVIVVLSAAAPAAADDHGHPHA